MAPCDANTRVKQPTNADDVRTGMYGLLSALSHVHGKGLIHADIKPHNVGVMLKPDQTCEKTVLLDFGNVLAQEVQGSQRPPQPQLPSRGVQVCTLISRAPELLAERSDFTEMIDMWSAGVVWLFWLRQEYPFGSDSEEAVAAAILDTLWTGGGQTEQELRRYYNLHKRRRRRSLLSSSSSLHKLDVELLTSMLCLEPLGRPAAIDALTSLMRVGWLTVSYDGEGCWAPFSINSGEVQPEVLGWLRKSPPYTKPGFGPELQMDFTRMPDAGDDSGKEYQRQELQLEGRKLTMTGCRRPKEGGTLFNKTAGRLLPHLHPIAWLNALLDRAEVDSHALTALDEKLRSNLTKLPAVDFKHDNTQVFFKSSAKAWLWCLVQHHLWKGTD